MDAVTAPAPSLRTAVVLRVEEHTCDLWRDGADVTARYAPQFPGPRRERVSPGHLVALATAPDGAAVVLWRWYDAVVVGHEASGAVRLWEPAHGEVLAHARASYERQAPGSRVYASAGLPGADWWAAGPVAVAPPAPATEVDARVELDAVAALYTDNDLWFAALGDPDAPSGPEGD